MDLTKTPQEVFRGNPPSALKQPDPVDVVVLAEEQNAAIAALEAQAEDLAATVEALDAVVSENMPRFATAAEGIDPEDGVAVGAQYRVISTDPDVSSYIYRHDVIESVPTATLIETVPSVSVLGDKASVAVAGPIAQNLRTSSFLSRGYFVAEEVTGPWLYDLSAIASGVAFSIVSGEIVVTSGTTQNARNHFHAGHRREPGATLLAEVTMEVPSGATPGVGPMLAVGSGTDMRYYYYSYTGGLNVLDYNFAALAANQTFTSTGATYTGGEIVRLRLFSRGDGTGWMCGINAAGVAAYRMLTGIPTGPVYASYRDTKSGGGSAFKIKGLAAKSAKDEGAVLPAPKAAPVNAMVRNLLPSDGVATQIVLAPDAEYDGEFALGTGSTADSSGTLTPVDMGDYWAYTLSGSRSLRTRFPITPGEDYSFHFLFHGFEPNVDAGSSSAAASSTVGLFLVEQDASGNTEVTHTARFHHMEPGVPYTYTFEAGADSVQLLPRIVTIADQSVTFSHFSLAETDKPGFYQGGTTLTDLADRVAALESGASVYAEAVRISAHLLPTPPSLAGREPPGITCTGATKIRSGAETGWPILADDGRLVEDDLSPYAPAIHKYDPDCRTCVGTLTMPWEDASIQGIDMDSAGTGVWVSAASEGSVKHISLSNMPSDGTAAVAVAIGADEYDWVGAGHASTPNSLCRDPATNTLWVGPITGNVLRNIDCDPGADPRMLGTITLSVAGTNSGTSPDQTQWLAGADTPDGHDRIIYTVGANGSDGQVRVYDMVTGVDAYWATLPGSRAIEQALYDPASGLMEAFNDTGFHAPGWNMRMVYRMPPLPGL